MKSLIYTFNKSTEHHIKEHLYRVDQDFKPALHTYVDIDNYSQKMAKSAVRLEYFKDEQLIGLMAGYYNKEKQSLFITNFSIEKQYRGQGMELIIELLKLFEARYSEVSPETLKLGQDFGKVLQIDIEGNEKPIKNIHTEVRNDNNSLIFFYKKLGFLEFEKGQDSTYLIRKI